jgi:hypothetical protein
MADSHSGTNSGQWLRHGQSYLMHLEFDNTNEAFRTTVITPITAQVGTGILSPWGTKHQSPPHSIHILTGMPCSAGVFVSRVSHNCGQSAQVFSKLSSFMG